MMDKPKEKLEHRLGTLLTQKNLSLSLAESCTGGLISHRLTNIPGSSLYIKGGIIAYDNAIKINLLKIPAQVIAEKGAVSKEVASLMAQGVRQLMESDIGIGVTGIAGPTGGTKEKPVGLVYIGIATGDKTEVQKFLFTGEREEIKAKTADEALAKLLKLL
ncbi:CinA family protein [Candidatus Auribacterota bacterium]